MPNFVATTKVPDALLCVAEDEELAVRLLTRFLHVWDSPLGAGAIAVMTLVRWMSGKVVPVPPTVRFPTTITRPSRSVPDA